MRREELIKLLEDELEVEWITGPTGQQFGVLADYPEVTVQACRESLNFYKKGVWYKRGEPISPVLWIKVVGPKWKKFERLPYSDCHFWKHLPTFWWKTNKQGDKVRTFTEIAQGWEY